MDAVGTNIRLDSRGRAVLRAVPRINEDVNEEWAHDKTRHAVDGLTHSRLDKPYVREDGKLVAASWAEAFDAIKAHWSGEAAVIAGDYGRLRNDVCGARIGGQRDARRASDGAGL